MAETDKAITRILETYKSAVYAKDGCPKARVVVKGSDVAVNRVDPSPRSYVTHCRRPAPW